MIYMDSLCKYEKEQEFVSYDGGITWSPLQEFRAGQLIEYASPDCGDVGIMYRWELIDNDYVCVGKDKYTKLVYQVSYDNGLYWYNVYPTTYQAGELVESNSEFCDNASIGHYSGETVIVYVDPVWVTKCDGNETVLTSTDIRRTDTQCLTSITITDCVVGIDDYTFAYQCLTSITIPSSVTFIGNEAFKFCENIEHAYLPNSITSIGYGLFYGCTNLKSISIPNQLTSLTPSLFKECTKLNNIVIPNNITAIGEQCFESCSGLTSIVIPNSVTSLGSSAFTNCASLSSVTIGNGITSIDNYAFGRCGGLSSITIPNSVTSIGGRAFQYCSSLKNINIPNSVTSITGYAFQYCTGLTSVTIGSGITIISDNPFDRCSNLTSVTIKATTPPTYGDSVFAGNNCTVYVPCESVRTYRMDRWWSSYASRIQGIPPCETPPIEYKFKGTYMDGYGIYSAACDSSSAVTSATTKQNGHYPASKMISAEIGDCVTSIGNMTFSDCKALSSVTIGNSVASIGNYAFQGCSGLTNIVIPNSVTSIGNDVFSACTNLSSVTIGNSVESIGQGAFYKCSSLTSVTIGNSATSIGRDAFSNCSGLTSITIEATTPPTLGANAFYGTNNCPIYVPCSSVDTYKVATRWSTYANRIQGIPPCDEPSPTPPQYRTTSGAPYCNAFDKYVDVYSQVSYDGGETWETTARTNTLLESNSTYCGYVPITPSTKWVGMYLDNYGSTGCSSANCDSTSAITQNEVPQILMPSNKVIISAQIGDCVTSIGDDVFHLYDSLTSVTIGNSVTSIGDWAFQGCGLTSVVIPNNVETIGQGAFDTCTALTSVTIGSGINTIDKWTFDRCSGLTEITIPDNVEIIAREAFDRCLALTSVTIGSGVTSIGDYAFHWCDRIESFKIYAVTPPTLTDTDAFYSNCTIYVPSGSVNAYKTASGWSNYADRIVGF